MTLLSTTYAELVFIPHHSILCAYRPMFGFMRMRTQSVHEQAATGAVLLSKLRNSRQNDFHGLTVFVGLRVPQSSTSTLAGSCVRNSSQGLTAAGQHRTRVVPPQPCAVMIHEG
jgi:hypothetical protein